MVAVLSFVLLLMLFGQLFTLKNGKTKEDKKSDFKGIDNTIFTEKITFAKHPEAHKGKKFNVIDDPTLNKVLDNAIILLFGHFKSHLAKHLVDLLLQ